MKNYKPQPQPPLFFVAFLVGLTFSTPLIGFAQEPTPLSEGINTSTPHIHQINPSSHKNGTYQ